MLRLTSTKRPTATTTPTSPNGLGGPLGTEVGREGQVSVVEVCHALDVMSRTYKRETAPTHFLLFLYRRRIFIEMTDLYRIGRSQPHRELFSVGGKRQLGSGCFYSGALAQGQGPGQGPASGSRARVQSQGPGHGPGQGPASGSRARGQGMGQGRGEGGGQGPGEPPVQ